MKTIFDFLWNTISEDFEIVLAILFLWTFVLIKLTRFHSQVGNLEKEVKEFKVTVDKRFDQVDKRFDQVDARFDKLEAKMDRRFEKMDEKFEKMDEKFDKLNDMLDNILIHLIDNPNNLRKTK